MHIDLSHADVAAVRLAALLSGFPDAESFCHAVVTRSAENLLDSARERTDNNHPSSRPDASNPSPAPPLRIYRGK